MVSPVTSYPHNSKKSFDAIVIGAGLAGLTVAAFLAQGGARVLVREQAAQIGGLFNSFWLGGCQFDGGIKEAAAYGRKAALNIWQFLNAPSKT